MHLPCTHKQHSYKLLGYLVYQNDYMQSGTVKYSWIIHAVHLSLPHTSISLVHSLSSFWSSWCLVLVDPKASAVDQVPSWTVRAPSRSVRASLIPLIFVGSKIKQTLLNSRTNWRSRLSTVWRQEHFSLENLPWAFNKKVDKPNLKNWNGNYLLVAVVVVSDNRALINFI